MKKNARVFAICMLAVALFASCKKEEVKPHPPVSPPDMSASPQDEGSAGLSTTYANPYEDFDTFAKAEENAGFDLILPMTVPQGYHITGYRTIKGSLLEVIYQNGGEEIRLRKAAGEMDISGNYEAYEESNEVEAGSLTIKTRGKDGKVYVAAWIDGGYSYSLTSNAGFDGPLVFEMVSTTR